MDKYGSRINFLTVYIMEAHATDTWPMGFEIEYKQTNTLEERAKVARDFIANEKYPYTLRIDEAPSNSFNELFAAWPLRFYVVDNGFMSYIHEPEGEFVLVERLTEYLESRFEH